MAAKKTKAKKKPMTLDDFAFLIQQDLSRMATKDDLGEIRGEMRTGFAATNENFKVVFSQIKDLREDLRQTTDAMLSKADLANAIDRGFETIGARPPASRSRNQGEQTGGKARR
jgi:hypothetical protein